MHGKHTLDLGTQPVGRIEEPMGGHVLRVHRLSPAHGKTAAEVPHVLKIAPCVTEDCSSMESKDAENPGKHTNPPLPGHKRKKKWGLSRHLLQVIDGIDSLGNVVLSLALHSRGTCRQIRGMRFLII